MDAATERALQAIDEAVAEVRRMESGPVVLTAEYLHAVEAIERLPQNQSGADKTWLERAIVEFEAHFARARRL